MISIVIPTFKRPDLLERLLNSISMQTFNTFEVIIVDDKSSNVEEYSPLIEKFKDVMDIHFYTNEVNSGAPYCRNRGIEKSKFELIALVDDDDEWLPTKLEKQLAYYNGLTYPDKFGILATWTKIIENGSEIGIMKPTINDVGKKNILEACKIPSPSVMVSKKAIVDSNFFDEKMLSCQDWDMWTRIIWNGYECHVLEDCVTIYHKHQQGSIGLSPRARAGYRRYYRKHFIKAVKSLNFHFLKRFVSFHINK